MKRAYRKARWRRKTARANRRGEIVIFEHRRPKLPDPRKVLTYENVVRTMERFKESAQYAEDAVKRMATALQSAHDAVVRLQAYHSADSCSGVSSGSDRT